jgi:riboflavin synthase
MFTGIVTDIGRVRTIEKKGDTRLAVETSYDVSKVPMGASISHAGVCLTVVDKGNDQGQNWFAVDVSDETLRCTTMGTWVEGNTINLERPVSAGGEFGGHIVSGHVDGVGEVLSIEAEGDSQSYTFQVTEDIKKFIARKGSITVDGVSLTVNKVHDRSFTVNLIPHTQEVTTLGQLQSGDEVNLEVDMLARYVARLMEVDRT